MKDAGTTPAANRAAQWRDQAAKTRADTTPAEKPNKAQQWRDQAAKIKTDKQDPNITPPGPKVGGPKWRR